MLTEKKITAIVPAYNEEATISHVVGTLLSSLLVEKVIVVDDGSKNSLDWLSQNFPEIMLIRHKENKGKATAMNTGVLAAKTEHIFFCDADLYDLQKESLEAIIRPVLLGKHRMVIGVRKEREPYVFGWLTLLSGQRSIHRADWEALPLFYKQGFRIETGLNAFIRKRGSVGLETIPYAQIIKEQKYGFWEGTKARWKMNKDIATALLFTAKERLYESFSSVEA